MSKKKDAELKVKTMDTEVVLKCDLTETELLEAGALMANAQQTVNGLQEELKEVQSGYKTRIGEAEGVLRRQADRIRTRFEHRPVKCRQSIDYGAALVTTVRLDTGEITEQRGLTEQERQMELQWFPPTAKSKKEKAEAGPGVVEYPERPERLSGPADEAAPDVGSPESDIPEKPAVDRGDVTNSELELALRVMVETGRTGASAIQRRMRVSFNRASQIIQAMEDRGMIGPAREDGPREILAEIPTDKTEDEA